MKDTVKKKKCSGKFGSVVNSKLVTLNISQGATELETLGFLGLVALRTS